MYFVRLLNQAMCRLSVAGTYHTCKHDRYTEAALALTLSVSLSKVVGNAGT